MKSSVPTHHATLLFVHEYMHVISTTSEKKSKDGQTKGGILQLQLETDLKMQKQKVEGLGNYGSYSIILNHIALNATEK